MAQRLFSIAFVDTDAAVSAPFIAALRQQPYKLFLVTGAGEMMEIARRETPDLILLGGGLPDREAESICAELKRQPDIGQILVARLGARRYTLDGNRPVEQYADAYLPPPASTDQLLEFIRMLERMKSVEDQSRTRRVVHAAAEEQSRRDAPLGASEEFFKVVTENSSDMVLILNKRGIVTYASPSVERFLGFSPQEMIGKSSFRFIHAAEVDRAMRDFGKAVRSKEIAVPNSFRVVHKDGTDRMLEGLGRNLLDHPTIRGFIMNVHDVTERKRAEDAMRLYGHTLESISEIVTITDLEDRFTFVNQAFLRVYGYTRQEVLGQHVQILWSHNNPDGLLKEILEQNRTRSWTGELLNRTKDGREFPILLHTSRIVDDKGRLIGLVGISEDITERKQAEINLRESEAKFRELVEQINEVIFATGMDGRFTYVSPMAESLGGYKPEEMLGHSITEFVDPDFLPKVQSRFEQPLEGSQDPMEFRVRVKSGESRWVRSSSKVILDGGTPVGMRGVLADITEEKKSQETVNLLSHTVKSVGECVCITDHKNIILFVNQSFLSTYGYTEKELIGKHISIVNPAVQTVDTVLLNTLQGGWQGELVNVRKDGTKFPVLLSTSVVLDEEGHALALVGVATDITERKELARKIELQQQHLQESFERLRQLESARDTLLNMIVHDMRSRLFILMVGLEFLEEHESENIGEENRAVLYQALTTTGALSRMVNSLLDISKMESGEMTLTLSMCDLAALARRVVSDYELQRESRAFVLDVPKGNVVVECDSDLILRVIQNLFSNALKHTTQEGQITLRVQKDGGEARVSVVDNGTGIPSQHLSRIFHKFYQVEPRRESTGLGLTFCKLAVELHGGGIGVESEPGRGSTFWFTLPEKPDH